MLMGEAEAERVKLIAEADAEARARVGIGKAIAIEEQVRAYGGPQLQLVQDVMTKTRAGDRGLEGAHRPEHRRHYRR